MLLSILLASILLLEMLSWPKYDFLTTYPLQALFAVCVDAYFVV